MCGVFAAISPDPSAVRVAEALAALGHRGPSESGTFVDPELGVCLGHARLAVIDLESGRQPLVDPDSRIALVCNGLICDFDRLRRRLERDGYRFRTRSDSEIIIPLYLRHGLRCTDHLRGEFAFLLVDRARRRLIACRDRFGVKPLYLTRTAAGTWAFASEAKAIFAAGIREPEIDLWSFYTEENGSLFRGIYELPPATTLVVDLATGTGRVTTYWQPDLPRAGELEEDRPPGAWREAVDEALTEAVRLRMRADVPVGIYLSGGIDSALVAAKAARLADRPAAAFSVSFTDAAPKYDEGGKARRIARALGLDHEVVEVDREALWSHLEAALWHNEAPLPLVSVAKFLLAERARRRVRVVLTGEGADEVFLGYEWFGRPLADGREVQLRGFGAPRRGLGWPGEQLKRRLIDWASRGGFRPAREPDPLETLLPRQSEDFSQLDGRTAVVRLQYRWLKTGLRRTILTGYGDRMEMAHSVEGRLPFLDHHLFAVARRIPLRLLVHDGVEKYILRAAADPALPREVLERRKWRFSVPPPTLAEGRAGGAAARVFEEYLSREVVEAAGLFRWAAVREIRRLRRLPPSRRAADRWLFAICCLHILQRRFGTAWAAAAASPPRPRTAGR